MTSGTGEVNQWDIRIDHKLSDKDSLFGSLSWSNEDKFNTPPFPVLDGAALLESSRRTLVCMMSWTRVWSPTVITESRIAFSRLVTSRVQANADEDLQKAFGIGGLQTFTDLNGGLPTIVPEGYDGGAAPVVPSGCQRWSTRMFGTSFRMCRLTKESTLTRWGSNTGP